MSYYAYLYIDPRTDEPFYAGKGQGKRAYERHDNKQVNGRIKLLKSTHIVEFIHALDESSALWIERMLIAAYGRKDNGTGILFNHTDGGESPMSDPAVVKKVHETKVRTGAYKRAGQLTRKRLLGVKQDPASVEKRINPLRGRKRPEHSNWMSQNNPSQRPDVKEMRRQHMIENNPMRRKS